MRALRPEDQQWIFPQSALDHTPSRQDGISLPQELEARKLTISWIRSLWLRVSGAHESDPEYTAAKGVITVGAILVHRFYMRRSVKDFEPKLIAPTILFLASKIEEGPLRLRHIVNACLAKFEPSAPHWDPKSEPEHQPLEYRRWEKEILATEEVALEALCFNMVVEQPWPVLRRSVRGIDRLWDGEGKGKGRASEAVIDELGWAMLNEGLLSPIGILHTECVLAFAVFVLILQMVEQVGEAEALAVAAEIGGKFDLDVEFDEVEGAKGEDLQDVKDALRQYVEYCQSGLIDPGLLQYIKTAPSHEPQKYQRRFKEVDVKPDVKPNINGKLAAPKENGK